MADILRQTRRSWQTPGVVSAAPTGILKGSVKRPDILVVEPNTSPVVIESELVPAVMVEADAVAQLGEQLRDTERMILASVAVRLPSELRQYQGALALQAALHDADDLEMALYTGSSPATTSRLPHSGWMHGDIADLSLLTQFASVPPDVIDRAVNVLAEGVSEAAGLLGEIARTHAGATHNIGEELRQEDCEQTRRMAMTIMANAFVFHENLAGGPGKLKNIRSIEELRGNQGLTKATILAEWRKILDINYWPIFDIARRILEHVPTAPSQPIIDRLAKTASQLVENRLTRSHDLTGAVFQRLIADRKFLATFYTTPAAAALLAGLAISPERLLGEGAWQSGEDIKKLRVADFACGTGTLLSMAYQRIGQLHEAAGGDAEALHPAMMAEGLVGCDVFPSAAHLTASMLAGAHPTTTYEKSSVLTVAYGKQNNERIALGALDLLDPQGRLEFFAITAQAAHGMGEAEAHTWRELPHRAFDLVIMNPPFTRPTGHEGKKIGIPNPMFAAFGSSAEEQREMGKATAKLAKGTTYHGNAGEASLFLALGDRKLKLGGILALVMPVSLISGDAWEKSRRLLTQCYTDLVVVSIAGARDADLSFSADTGMGECLIVGRKAVEHDATFRRTMKRQRRATFVVLNERPAYLMVGAQIARQIRRLVDRQAIHRLEAGPLGGTPIAFGNEIVGQAIDAPLPESGGWLLSRIRDLSLAQTAYQLATNGKLWLPTMSKREALSLPMATVKEIGRIGPYHADVEGLNADGSIRGPFRMVEVKPGSLPTYPVLWLHHAERERTMIFEADREGVPLKGKSRDERDMIAKKVEAIWDTASHCHLNRDFRFNSQSTSMQFTTRKTIGGRAWISISLATPELEKALVLWSNSTLGLLLYWWYANKSQAGRGSIGVNAVETLPVLDVTKLSAQQLADAAALFDEMGMKELLPVNEIDKDEARHELDTRLARDILGMKESLLVVDGPLGILRQKLAHEPSIHGGKIS